MQIRSFRAFFLFLIMGFFFSLLSSTVLGQEVKTPKRLTISPNQSLIKFETDAFSLEVTTDGRVSAMTDRIRNKDILAQKASVKFMKLQTKRGAYEVSHLSLDGDLLSAEFGRAEVTATFHVKTTPELFSIELASVSNNNFDFLEFLRLPVGITKNVATLLNAAYDDHYAVAVLAATPETNADIIEYLAGGRGPLLGARCWPAVSLENVRAVVLGCARDTLMQNLENFELSQGLPHPTIDGEWAKRSNDLLQGYLFCDLKKDNLDAAISYAKQGGFRYILVLSQSWSSSYGSYPINKKSFPGGMTDLKKAVAKIHANGLKAGLHFIAAGISARDRYVTPAPDVRLHKKEVFTLAERVSAESKVLQKEPLFGTYFPKDEILNPNENTIQLGNELMICTPGDSPHNENEYHYRRGAYGTNSEFHLKGQQAYRLTQQYNLFLPDPKTDLIDEISDRIADVYNTCDFDMVYVDGGEAMMSVGPGWYTMGLIHSAFFSKIDGEVLWQGSGTPHYSWHYVSRLTCRDAVHFGPKAYSDKRKTPLIQNYYRPNFITPDIGWWGFYANSPSVPATVPDEIEYMCAKAVGWDAAISLLCKLESLASNGRTAETLARVKLWQQAQLQDAFPDHIKQRLREPKQDFWLLRNTAGDYTVRPVTHLKDHIVDPNDAQSTVWPILNQTPQSTISFRLRALSELAPYGSKTNLVLYDPGTGHKLVSTASEKDRILGRTELAPDDRTAGGPVLKIAATSQKNTKNDYVRFTKTFSDPIDLSNHRIPGLWIHGADTEGVLNLQLEDTAGKFRDHYLDIDFSGWRYFVLQQPETRKIWDFDWKYNKEYCLRDFNYERVSKVNLYLTHIDSAEETTIFIGRIESLREYATATINPSLTINQHEITLPVEMQPDDYLECDDQGNCRQFNASGQLTGTFSRLYGGNMAIRYLDPGDNRIGYVTSGKARASISIRLNSPPLE